LPDTYHTAGHRAGTATSRSTGTGTTSGRLSSRTRIYVYRALAQLVGVTERDLRALVRVSFAKVAEYQQRGGGPLPRHHPPGRRHRLRLPSLCGGPAAGGFTAELLEAAVRKAAEAVTVPCPVLDDDQGVTLTARWGEQLDVRYITGDDEGGLSAEQVAGYVAKYATRAPRPWASPLTTV
jgi:hypothetical protein